MTTQLALPVGALAEARADLARAWGEVIFLAVEPKMGYTSSNEIRCSGAAGNSPERDGTTLEVARMEDSTPIYLTPTNLKFTPTKDRRRRRGCLKKLRPIIRRRDGGRCVYCGDVGAALDHIIPHCKGGPDTEENLVLACVRCNSTAGGRVFGSFEAKRQYILNYRASFDADIQNHLLAICTDCFHAFRPRVGGASAFLCQECMELQDDERRNKRIREERADYIV